MAHGKPTGYDTLYDEKGNPVVVRLDRSTDHALAVSDKRVEQLVCLTKREIALLRAVLFQLAIISGHHVDEDTFLEE